MRGKREGGRVGERGEPGEMRDDELEEEALRQRVCTDLAKVGMIGEEARRVADAIVEQLRLTGPRGYEDLLAGVRFSVQVRVETTGEFDVLQREVKQLERLMVGCATELRKLDEVLEVLAAYVRRMRHSAGDDEDPLLH